MSWIDNIAKRFAKTATVAVTDSVKVEAKNAVYGAIPTLVGIGFAIAGVVIFRAATRVNPGKAMTAAKAISPTLSTTSIVTNNWFLDEASKQEVLSKFMDK